MKVVTLILKTGNIQTISIDELKAMKVSLSQEWENLCNKCGKCCFEKSLTEKGVLIIDYNNPCKYLKFIGRKASCSIYNNRFDNCNKCFTIPEAIQKRFLPGDCPYTKSVVRYKPPIDSGEWYKRAKTQLAKGGNVLLQYGGETPTGGTRNMPAEPPSREDLNSNDWKRRKLQQRLRAKGGKEGILDPREKAIYNIKPSGHGLGG